MARCKTDNLGLIKNLNLWGNELNDISLIKQMPNMEILSLSVNKISTLKDFLGCQKLHELYLRKNNISDLREIAYLSKLRNLKILWLSENPCAENPNYRKLVIKMLPDQVKLDNKNITNEERDEAEDFQTSNQQNFLPESQNHGRLSHDSRMREDDIHQPLVKYKSYEESRGDFEDSEHNSYQRQISQGNPRVDDYRMHRKSEPEYYNGEYYQSPPLKGSSGGQGRLGQNYMPHNNNMMQDLSLIHI